MKASMIPKFIYLVDFYREYYGTAEEYHYETKMYHSLNHARAGITYFKNNKPNLSRAVIRCAPVGEFIVIEEVQ